jgi:hypothetical protein
MKSFATSTERGAAAAGDAGRPDRSAWQFYLLISMAAATVAVVMSRNTHPAALLLISAAVLASGLVALALHRAILGFFSGAEGRRTPLSTRTRETLLGEKALVLRALKELEFDRGMGKVSEPDFQKIQQRLRARALVLMQELERAPEAADAPARRGAPAPAAGRCRACDTANDADAKFCKQCGKPL